MAERIYVYKIVAAVYSLSHVQIFVTPWPVAC